MASDPPDSSQLSSRLDALWVRDVGPGPALAQVTAPVAPEAPAASPPPSPPRVSGPDHRGPFLAATAAPTTMSPTTMSPTTMSPTSTAPPPTALWGSGLDLLSHPTPPTIMAPPPPPPRPPSSSAPPVLRRPGRRGRWVIEWALVLLVAVGVAVGIRSFVVQTFFIPSASMEPTLMIGDRILVDKLSYHMHAVHRGDIVVFGKPPGENAGPEVKDLVKRVIGLPGDRISSADGHVVINGQPLKEPWLVAGTISTGITPQTVPANEFFVMGDNRSDSQDSRYFGPISRSLIVGRVVVRIWPVSALHIF